MASACSSSTASNNGTSSAVTQLFTLEPTPDRNTLQKTATGYLATLLADPANQEITLVKVDPAVVSNKTQELAVTLPNGQTAQFLLRDYNTITPGIEGWVGYRPSAWKQAHPTSAAEIDNDPFYYLSLTRDGEKLVGSVTVEGQLYRIEYVSPGQYALLKVDETKLPPSAEPIELGGPAHADKTIGKQPMSARSFIRVLFVTTNEARSKYPNYKASLANALQDANQHMINSQVPITYEIAGYYDANHAEAGRTMAAQMHEFSNTTKGFGQEIYTLRGTLRADLASLYISGGEFCGLGKLAVDNQRNGLSTISCVHSLSHELGHNMGAHHNWEAGDEEGNPTYMFGYRQTAVAPRFSTQMSYGCSPACPRIPYYSNPRLTYQGLPLGTVRNHDVARRFNERREIVENIFPPADTLSMKLFSQENFQGDSCEIFNIHRMAVSISSQCGNQPVRSFKVSGYRAAANVCLYDQSGARHVCYAGGASSPRSFEVANVDQAGAPPTFVRSQKGSALSGAAVDLLYGDDAISLFAGADFTNPLCSFALHEKEYVVADSPGCPPDAGGKARSAKIFHQLTPGGQLSGKQWCFFNGDRSRTLCFKGAYWGKFGVANFDSVQGIPPEIVRTQSGGYMNGSVYRVKAEIVSVP